ncbi:MAG TPA: hypothetical protein VEI57_06900 [Nitrospirota bacterium]|nr:hypothetical protein [Nitrospirota bacterium]
MATFLCKCLLDGIPVWRVDGHAQVCVWRQAPIRPQAKISKDSKIHREKSRESFIRPEDATSFFAKQELLPVTNYLPDAAMIKKNGVSCSWLLEKYLWRKRGFTQRQFQFWLRSSAVRWLRSPDIMFLIWICLMNGPPHCAVSYTKRKE